jgi:hypothetical protein
MNECTETAMSDAEPSSKRQRLSTEYQGLKPERPTEHNVGIVRYVDESIPGFSGLIKHRFTDFLVHEVDLDGNIVHLTDVSRPEEATAAARAAPVKFDEIVCRPDCTRAGCQTGCRTMPPSKTRSAKMCAPN